MGVDDVMVTVTVVVIRPSELVGAIYARLHGKRSVLDTSRDGAYRYVLRRAPRPVWLVRSCNRRPEDEATSTEPPTALSLGLFPTEIDPNGQHVASCRVIVAAVGGVRLPGSGRGPSLWRRLCAFNLARVAALLNETIGGGGGEGGGGGDDDDEDGEKAKMQRRQKRRNKIEKVRKKAEEETQKEGEVKEIKGKQEHEQEQEEWRAFYAKHHWEWRLSDSDLRRAQRRLMELPHTHSFLGATNCRRPHL